MLNRINDLLKQKVDFAFETTLSARTYRLLIKKAQLEGYFVTLVYFWLNSVELAIQRVRSRVLAGGHSIPDETIQRRYRKGLENLSKIYLPICNNWMIYDNSGYPSVLIAEAFQNREIEIYNHVIYNQIIAS